MDYIAEVGKAPVSPRVTKLKEKFKTYKPTVCIERARVYTELYYGKDGKGGVLADEPLIIGRAKAFKEFLNRRTVYIEDDQLFAGSMASVPRGFPIYPESIGDTMVNEYRKLPTRDIDPFVYTDEDREELEELLKPWHGTSLRNLVFPPMSMEYKQLFLKNPETDIVSGTNVLTLDVPLNGPAGHITPDYQVILEQGFGGIKKRAEERLKQAEAEDDKEGIDFLKAAIISCEAIIDFAHRYADLADEMAEKENDPKRKAELKQIAKNCRNVPENPPSTFYEAIQALWFVFVGIQQESFQRCYSLGRFDSYAYQFLEKDLADGTLTLDQAQELVDTFWMKFPETNYINSEYYSHIASGFPSQQQVCIAGQTPDGKDASNLLSYMCIQASINTLLHQPVLSVRFFEGTPDGIVRKAAELAAKGTGHPSFFNDRRVVPALQSKGIALEDARDYSSVGCASVQPTRKDKGSHNSGYVNVASALEFALHDGYSKKENKQMSIHTGDARKFESYEEVAEAFEKQLAHLIAAHSEAAVRVEQAHKDLVPTPFVSCFVQDCIGKARDRSAGGAIYNSGMSPRGIGLADIVDSLAAIKKLVFEEKVLTMDQVMDAIDANFEGYEDIQAMLINKAPKYGNDEDYADDIAEWVVNVYSDETEKHRSLFGGHFHPGFSSVSSNVPYGTVISALPSGRKEWTPLADGCSPCHSVERNGPTAVAVSSGKLNHSGMSGGSILNVKFSPSLVRTEEGFEQFVNYIKGMLNAGVWHAQFNVADAATLRDAQKHPEKHSDLIVRVAGYSAFFTALSPMLQEDVITRTEFTKF